MSSDDASSDRSGVSRRDRVIAKKRRLKTRARAMIRRHGVESGKTAARPLPEDAVRVELNNLITMLLPDLLSIMRRLSGTMGSSPESLMNELMTRRLMRRTDFPRDRKPFIGWVLANLKGVMIDRIRSEVSRRRRERNRAEMIPDAGFSDGPELQRALKRLDQVDADGAMMVRMRYFAGMRVEDIALAFDVDRQTVGRKLKQSLAFLAVKLKHD